MKLRNKINDALVVIPARKGSKGVPKKNIKILNAKPLIEYTIEFALNNFTKQNIFISTDCDEVMQIAQSKGLNVPFKRPEELCRDDSSIHDTLKHVLNYFKAVDQYFSKTILLQPTSPFRSNDDLFQMVDLFDKDQDAIISVVASKSNPYFNLFETDSSGYLRKSKGGNYFRRQDCPTVYEFNGSIYIFNTKSLERGYINDFKKIRKYEMHPILSVDIDTDLDWAFAEFITTNFMDSNGKISK